MKVRDRFSKARSVFLAQPLPARTVFTAVAIAITVSVLLVFGRLSVWWLDAVSETARLEPRIARMLGFMEAKVSIGEALVQRDDMLSSMAFPDAGDSGRGGALLQQELRKLASSNGLTVIGSEVRDPEALADLDRLRVNVRVSGQPGNVEAFLAGLDGYRPFVFVSSLTINPQQRQVLSARRSNREQYDNRLIMEFDVHAYQIGGAQ